MIYIHNKQQIKVYMDCYIRTTRVYNNQFSMASLHSYWLLFLVALGGHEVVSQFICGCRGCGCGSGLQ